jgi:uncharacterized membrane protein YqiK
MPGGKKARGCEAPPEDQEWFIRENAVALVRARDAKIARLRERITKLEKTVRSHRLARRQAVAAAERRAALAEREGCAAQAEARARHNEFCPAGCRCADGFHIAAAIRGRPAP